MHHLVRTLGLVGGALATLSHAGSAQQRPASGQDSAGRRPAPRSGAPLAAPAAPSAARPIPFAGSLPPGDPPPAPPPRPLPRTDKQSLDVLYSRPSPMGPPPIAVTPARAIYVVGKAPLFRQKVGPIVYADKTPPAMVMAANGMDHFSNDNVVLPRGEIRFVSFDRTVNDTELSRDSMALEATLTDERGDEWRVLQTRIIPIPPGLCHIKPCEAVRDERAGRPATRASLWSGVSDDAAAEAETDRSGVNVTEPATDAVLAGGRVARSRPGRPGLGAVPDVTPPWAGVRQAA